MDIDAIPKDLEARLDYLEETHRFTVDALEMAASVGDFQSSINKLHEPSAVLKETGARVKRLIPFRAVVFYLVDEASSNFHPVDCDPECDGESLTEEVEFLIDNGTFAWTLRENRPVRVSTRDFQRQVILHVMATHSRIRGVFAGILAPGEKNIPEVSLSLLSIILLNSANALESYELYKMVQEARSELEDRIKERTLKLIEANEKLQIEIADHTRFERALRVSEEQAKQLAQENAIMAGIGRIISSTLNIDEVYERFAEEARKLIPFDRVSINLYDPEEKTATTAYSSGTVEQVGAVFPLAGTAGEEVMRARCGLLLHPEDEEELGRRFSGLLLAFQAGHRSMMVAPLISKDKVVGTLLFGSTQPSVFTDRDLRLAVNIGAQIAGAIANAQLFAERKKAEEKMASLQEQLRQAQKMEAIGHLAGGIAHDFNNILTIINGRSELALLRLVEEDPLRGNIEEIKRASERAASLTQQLLAFGRRQILEFKVLDLNAILLDLNTMLRRVIGEDIELITVPGEDLGKVKTDPSQVEQVILNLAVNARDAMPNGGRLMLETANAELDEEYARAHVGVNPGSYVRLSVSDTGVGMSSELKERIFEPFFTTKEKGKGTGLGLSTVYGIVKQSGGNIWVYSEPGHGTVFKIYLPRVDGPVESRVGERDEGEDVPYGNETILLVEDEREVRELAAELLTKQGYTVLEAQHGDDAFLVCGEYKGSIDLMVTDVVMPGMSGRELAGHLASLRPEMRVLYMSGYTDNAIVHHGVLEEGVNFIQKPFSIVKLAKKVREILDKDTKSAVWIAPAPLP